MLLHIIATLFLKYGNFDDFSRNMVFQFQKHGYETVFNF